MFNEESKTKAIQKYLNFVYEKDEVIQTIKVTEFSEGTPDHESKTNKKVIGLSMEQIMNEVAEKCNVSVKDLISKRRYKEIVIAKKVLIWFCSEYTILKQVEVAMVLGVTQASVSKALRNRDEKVMEIVEELVAKF